MDLDASGHAAIDHFGWEESLGAADHAAVLARGATTSPAVLPSPLPGPVLFRGIGMSVSPESETVSPEPQGRARRCFSRRNLPCRRGGTLTKRSRGVCRAHLAATALLSS